MTLSAETPPINKLKKRQPNWHPKKIEAYSDGTPKTILWYEPNAVLNQDIPAKLITYTANGIIERETDLIVVDTDSAAAKQFGTTVIPHGYSISYSPTAKIEKIAYYHDGVVQGPVKTYDSNGLMRSLLTFNNGVYNGPYESYFENGLTSVKGNYQSGVKSGEWCSSYPNGKQASKCYYENGLLQGEALEWYETGTLKSKAFYSNGLLHGDRIHTAKTRYYPERTVQEIVDYRQGQPFGVHVEYHTNGKESHRIVYKNWLKESEVYFSPDGTEIGQEEYSKSQNQMKDKNATIDETEIEKFENKQLKSSDANDKKHGVPTSIQREGKLNGKHEKFYPSGQLEAVLTYKDGILHGKKAYWNEAGVLVEEAFYDHGSLEGRYYLCKCNGQEQISHYKGNQLDGLHQLYYPHHNDYGRIKELEATFSAGLLEGEVSEYSPAGIKIVSTFYHLGKKEGISTLYSPEGQTMLTAEFQDDKQHGMTCEYYPSGKIAKEVKFANDLKEGEEKVYFQDGKTASIYCYKQGQLHGNCREWNTEGTLLFEGHYQDGKKHGTFNKYTDEGKLRLLFDADKLIKKEKMD